MNNDLISRSALKKAIKTECNPYGKPTIDFESGKKVLKIIDHAPTVEYPFYAEAYQTGYEEGKNERPTGEWIEREEWYETYYECSVCKEPWCTFEGTPVDNLMNYCPCCGARMEGVRKSEEEGEDE